MADADKSLKVAIEGDSSGLVDASKKGADSIKEFAGETKKSAAATEEHTGKSRASFLLFSELNKIVPGLGHAIHAAFAGPLAPIIGAGIAIAEVTQHIKELNKELDKQAEDAAISTFIDSIKDRLGVFQDAAVAAQGFADAMENSDAAADTLNTRLKDQLSTLQAIERAQAGLTSAQKELDIAKIQQSEAAGKMTPEQVAKARYNVEKQYLEKAQRDKEEFQDKEVKARKDALALANDQNEELFANQQAAHDRLTQDLAHRASVKIDPEEQKKQIDAAQKAVEKTLLGQQAANRLADNYTGSENPDDQRRAAELRQNAQADVDVARGKLSLLNKQLDQYNATQTDGSKSQLKKEQDDAAAADEAVKKNNDLINELTSQLRELNQNIKATRPLEQQTTRTKEKTATAQENTRLSKQFDSDATVIHQYNNSENPSPELTKRAIEAIKDAQEIMADHKEVISHVIDLITVAKEIKSDQALLKQQMAGLSNRTLSQ